MEGGLRGDREDLGQKAALEPQHRGSPSPSLTVSATALPVPLTKTINLPELTLFCCELEKAPCLKGSAAPADLKRSSSAGSWPWS